MTCKERKEKGIYFSVSYCEGRPDLGATFTMYKKDGRVKGMVILNERDIRDIVKEFTELLNEKPIRYERVFVEKKKEDEEHG